MHHAYAASTVIVRINPKVTLKPNPFSHLYCIVQAQSLVVVVVEPNPESTAKCPGIRLTLDHSPPSLPLSAVCVELILVCRL